MAPAKSDGSSGSRPACTSKRTVLTAHAEVDTQAGWYLEDWTVDSVSQLSSAATLSLGACAANVAVAAVFAEQYTVTVEVYPDTIDENDPNAPAPGEITLACSDPVSCGTFEALGTPTEDAALEWIAEEALKKETGARALRAIIEDFMLDIMYEIPKDPNIGSVLITRSYLERSGGPLISMRD